MNPARAFAQQVIWQRLTTWRIFRIIVNLGKAFVEWLVGQSPIRLLILGITISCIDFAMLYAAAAREGVLHIDQGVGLLNNYGLFSTILGNAIALSVAKKYYDVVCSIESSKAIKNTAPIKAALSTLHAMIKMEGKYKFFIFLLIIIGSAFWLSNLSYHLFGNPEIKWAHKVFDSKDHLGSFIASRAHNLYTWMFIAPLVVHIMVYSSLQLRQAIASASDQGALTYDLLNPDQRGGFMFVDKAHIAFNVVISLVYIQVLIHTGTFGTLSFERVVTLIFLTVMLVASHRLFLGNIYATIRTLRLESLNQIKEKVYNNDELSFEILKYCYDRRIRASSIIDFFIKAAPIVVPGLGWLWPIIVQLYSKVVYE